LEGKYAQLSWLGVEAASPDLDARPRLHLFVFSADGEHARRFDHGSLGVASPERAWQG
jgi:hypothetical protein